MENKELYPVLLSTEAVRSWCRDSRILCFCTLRDSVPMPAEPLIVFIPRDTNVVERRGLRKLAALKASILPQVFLVDEREDDGWSSDVHCSLVEGPITDPRRYQIDLVKKALYAALKLNKDLQEFSLEIVSSPESLWLEKSVKLLFGHAGCFHSDKLERRLVVAIAPREAEMPLGRIYDLMRDGDRCVMVYESKDNPGEGLECAPGTIVVCSNFQLELSGVLCDAQTIANAILLEHGVSERGA